MERRHRLAREPRNPLHRVEPLEDRWLLSGLASPADPLAEPRQPFRDVAVEVVEFGVASESAEGEVEIATSSLPRRIVAAIDARFPGARLVEAESNSEDGTTLYEVNAEWSNRLFGVTLTPDGRIIAIERALTPNELPPPVLDWVRQNFPGAVIGAADMITAANDESYDLLIATPGRQEFEATLRVQDAQSSGASNRAREDFSGRFDAVLASDNATMPHLGSLARSETTSRSVPLESETHGKSGPRDSANRAAAAHVAWHEQAESQRADSVRAAEDADHDAPEQSSVAVSEPSRNTTAVDTLKARASASQATLATGTLRPVVETLVNASPAPWLPQIAGVLGDVLPIDVAAVEQGLQQLLGAIDSLAERVVIDTAVSGHALRLAIVGTLITGAELVILESRKPSREPVLESNAAGSSWSWVLGAAKPQ